MRRAIALFILASSILAVGAAPVLAVVAGDEPATAIAVGPGTATYDSSAMSENSAVDPATCGDLPGALSNTMWFRYAPTRDAMTIVDVNSFVSEDGTTDFLAGVAVYRVQGSTHTLITCAAYPATIFLPAKGGATYLILVAGLNAEATGEPELSDRGGTFDLTIQPIKGRVLRDHFHDAGSFVDEESCSEPMTVSWDDNGTFKTFLDASGARRYTTFFQGATTFAVDGGATLVIKYAQTFTDRLDGTGVITGLAQDVWLDGQRVVKDVGRLVFDFETGEVLFDAGRHPQWYEGLDICAELGI